MNDPRTNGSPQSTVRIRLRSRVTCPHCWRRFAPEDTLWVAAHPDLLDDPQLGENAQQRFLPSRFTAEGNAIDPKGVPCQELACPACHLSIPRAMLEISPLFISITGTPSCGKSYFLASMTWKLRQTLPRYFASSFGDADPVSNKVLNQYEEEQFFNPDRDAIVRLAKTEEQGDMYDVVRHGDQVVTYPKPFLFTLRPSQVHPNYEQNRYISRVVCLYDNAGESFQPGRDTVVNPVTRHLALSQVLMFCFDPTQDPRFRDACRKSSRDYQVQEAPVTARQEIVLHEIADRVRKHTGLGHADLHERPLVIIVTKYDAWWPLLGKQRLEKPWTRSSSGSSELCGLNLARVNEVSAAVRKLLFKTAPELVSAAEGFCKQVLYIPVSATGRAPETDPETGRIGIRPRDVRPMWCEVPLLVALARRGGIIPYSRQGKNEHAGSR